MFYVNDRKSPVLTNRLAIVETAFTNWNNSVEVANPHVVTPLDSVEVKSVVEMRDEIPICSAGVAPKYAILSVEEPPHWEPSGEP